ncbi:MAG: hypothetical protein MJ162_05635 [Treponema sp.]|nr:hypothetical protein [Treponema sp.]
MKKQILVLTTVMCILAGLVSCGKKDAPILDDCGCYIDVYTAKKAAEKQKKDMLVFITVNHEDYSSEDLIDNVLMTDEFDEQIKSKYVVCHLDFSGSTAEKFMIDETATDAEKLAAEPYKIAWESGYQFASLLACQYTPAIYMFTKEGYVVAEVEYDEEITDVAKLQSLLSVYDDDKAELEAMVAATKKGSKLDQVKAIDAFYKATPENFRYFMLDLAVKIPSLDKNNESGLVADYVLVSGEQKVSKLLMQNDVAGAAQEFLSIAKNPYLNKEQQMDCYFNAAYFLSMSGAATEQEVLAFLQQGLAIDPESPNAEKFKQAISYFSNPENFE